MSKARTSPVRTALVHATLIFYMLIAVFPVALTLINSFKSRNAIFREPLRFPTPESFSLIGYETVLKQGSFLTYFQNSAIVTVVSIFLVILFGAMAAFALAEYR
ncbi:carbohydrate ABC transporter permease, partial [Brucella abortus]